MDRRVLLQSLAAGGVLALGSAVEAKTAGRAGRGADQSVTFAVLLDAKPGKSREEILEAIKSVVNIVKGHPGLIASEVLENPFNGQKPNYVHITRWRHSQDWQNLYGDKKFLAAQDRVKDVVVYESSGVFKRVM